MWNFHNNMKAIEHIYFQQSVNFTDENDQYMTDQWNDIRISYEADDYELGQNEYEYSPNKEELSILEEFGYFDVDVKHHIF